MTQRLWLVLKTLCLAFSIAGFLVLLWSLRGPANPDFPYYLLAGPLFVSAFIVSIPLVSKLTNMFPISLRIGLIGALAFAFLLLVPVEVTAQTQYLSHCGVYSTVEDWKSLLYSYVGVGFHFFIRRPDYACLAAIQSQPIILSHSVSPS